VIPRVCTCGAAVEPEGVDGDVVGLPESEVLERIAKPAGFSFVEAVRLLRAIAGAGKDDADAMIAWLVREQHRLMRVAAEKSAARAAAIARAERAVGER
jgi:hypothetical protein